MTVSERPRRTGVNLFSQGNNLHVFVSDGSRIFDVPDSQSQDVETAFADPRVSDASLMRILGVDEFMVNELRQVPRDIGLRSISLNIAQACNLACSYCYAGQGAFGGASSLMNHDTAEQSIKLLLEETGDGGSCVIGFMGGEPFLNRDLLRHAVKFASLQAARRNIDVQFSITTNGTMISRDDAELLCEHDFVVQVSLDGAADWNDSLRADHRGRGTYERACRGVETLIKAGGPRLLTARATVLPQTGSLVDIIDHLLGLGFDEAGFAPVLVSPNSEQQFGSADFDNLLDNIRACGQHALDAEISGERYPFTNFHVAMSELHRGTHRPYPCGAGGAYMSVGAQGKLYACHRLIDDDDFLLGTVQTGVDSDAVTEHLKRNHVHQHQSCQACWARYLCGGGCYHEVKHRGRISCDYIRSWLTSCLEFYVQLGGKRPEYFLPKRAPRP